MCTETEKKYIALRKKNLKELRKLVLQRLELSSRINKIKKECNAWDNALIEG